MEELNEKEILELDEEESQEYIISGSEIDKLPPIMLELDSYNQEEFYRGVDETSYVAGVATALFNAGLSESSVLDYILTTSSIKHNKEAALINKEMNIEISKNAKTAQDKFEL